MPTCWWCDAELTAEQVASGGRFCGRTHSKRATLARAKRREAVRLARYESGRELCPHPWKLTYSSVETAQAWAVHDGLDAYLCICGRWHLGHSDEQAEENLVRFLAQVSRRRGALQLPKAS